MKTNQIALVGGFLLISLGSCGQSLNERLGYPKDSKLLIVHADDIGVSHSENQATFDAMAVGMVNSGSIMVPCPWFSEVVHWAKQHPQSDLGLHLTLNSEWKYLKWGPVAPINKVTGLVDSQGYFYDNVEQLVNNASVEEVELELRAQIEKALAAGLKPTHLDTHMGSVLNKKFFPIYLKLGWEYKIPVMASRTMLDFLPELKPLMDDKTIMIDHIVIANPEDFKEGMAAFYTKQLRSLPQGVTVLLMHLGYDNAEMQAMTVDHPDYGARWRQEDFDFFTSETCRQILKEEGIKLVTWGEIQGLIK
ncbi:MAG: polysaccharide deacetylase family protein [Cyclobacteriaceae bacterium]|nr:polysaccharide deacetylase family protein [Cyclobacteriaceae bacterium]